MFFKDHFRAVCDCLDAKFQGMKHKGQNSADRGELCELFVRSFLDDFLSDQFNVFRGGHVVDSMGEKSKQIDIVLTAKNTIRFFRDKGIYPVETVYGIVSVTATLDLDKLKSELAVFSSIPRRNLHFVYSPMVDKERFLRNWNGNCPYRCLFAFGGTIKEEWGKYLNELATGEESDIADMPHLVVLNKAGMFLKNTDSHSQK